ncbi:unnamed protein product [Cylicocyclus nassatus]|uniref:MADF domain-containing protein n=1 Tax=Cylicocyclus nassatus TaxID=53992 RepID=A0AA36MG00_CYLNA|nr:unnamed protein product [Cylicocyclus nassatus]
MDQAEQAYLCLCIEEERVIWDTSSDAYLSKTLRLEAWDRIEARMKKHGYNRTIKELQDMWKFLRSKFFRVTSGKTSGSSAKTVEFMKNMTFLQNIAIPTESRYTNFDRELDMDSAEFQPSTSKVPSVPVLGDLSNSISSLSSQRRKRKLSDDGTCFEGSAVRVAADAVMTKLDSIHVEDRYTHIGRYVESSLRRLSDEEADLKVLHIMAIFANVNISENLDHCYSAASAYQHSNR